MHYRIFARIQLMNEDELKMKASRVLQEKWSIFHVVQYHLASYAFNSRYSSKNGYPKDLTCKDGE